MAAPQAQAQALVLASILVFSCFAQSCYGMISFSSLQKTLVVTASHRQGRKSFNPSLQISFCFSESHAFVSYNRP